MADAFDGRQRSPLGRRASAHAQFPQWNDGKHETYNVDTVSSTPLKNVIYSKHVCSPQMDFITPAPATPSIITPPPESCSQESNVQNLHFQSTSGLITPASGTSSQEYNARSRYAAYSSPQTKLQPNLAALQESPDREASVCGSSPYSNSWPSPSIASPLPSIASPNSSPALSESPASGSKTIAGRLAGCSHPQFESWVMQA
eukprot:7409053-Pyramimonas_sp.AAC.3